MAKMAVVYVLAGLYEAGHASGAGQWTAAILPEATDAGDQQVDDEPGREERQALQCEAFELVEQLGDHER